MWLWITSGVVLGIAAISIGVWLGHRARVRRRQAWKRFARKEGYQWDADRDEVSGVVANVPFQIRALMEVDDDGESVSYTMVTFERRVELVDLGEDRTPLELEGDRSGWRRPGRARRTRVLRREVRQIERQIGRQSEPRTEPGNR